MVPRLGKFYRGSGLSISIPSSPLPSLGSSAVPFPESTMVTMAARVFTAALVAVALLDNVQGVAIKRQSVTALSQAQISTFKPFTFYASASYCAPSTTLTWTCGGMPKNTNCRLAG